MVFVTNILLLNTFDIHNSLEQLFLLAHCDCVHFSVEELLLEIDYKLIAMHYRSAIVKCSEFNEMIANLTKKQVSVYVIKN